MECKICGVVVGKKSKKKVCEKHYYFSLERRCGECNCFIVNYSKTGFCNKHRDRSGENNPMFGRTVYESWVEKFGNEKADLLHEESKNKIAIASKNLWEDESYRCKVIDSNIGKKRSQAFKDRQRVAAIEQMKDQKQRDLRSVTIHNSYIAGTHDPDHLHSNRFGMRGYHDGIFYASKVELARIIFLNESGVKWKRYSVNDFDFRLVYEFNGKNHVYIPDFVIYSDNGIIIEEMKSNINGISEFEKKKIEFAKEFFQNTEIKYRVIDNPRHSVLY